MSAEIDRIMQNAVAAAGVFSQFSQERVDRIVRAVYEAAFNSRVRLAKMAVEETGIGRWQDKVVKNVVATQLVYEDIKSVKTVGVIGEDRGRGIVEIAQPMGPILAIVPVTNPTSTVFFKTLICLKTRNPLIISPSGKARKCCAEAARVCYEAALAADAPEDCIQCLESCSHEQTQELMAHKSLALILATGGTSLVRAAYSSGTPAIGVGAGNVPVYVEASADVPFCVRQVLFSKTFDNGTICASEQAIVVERSLAAALKAEFEAQKGYFLTREEVAKLEGVVLDEKRARMNPAAVGQPAAKLAKLAGLAAPEEVQLLLAPLEGVGAKYPLSGEILAPVLAYYVAEDFDSAVNRCIDLNYFNGIGHSASIFSNNRERITQFALMMNAGRILVNQPSSQGGVGGIFNTLTPSLTLGCGTGGKNITTDNVGAQHLLNIQRIAYRRENAALFHFDRTHYLDETRDVKAIEAEYGRNYL
jgi:acetaldehyde dehydrogenase/alcohol dehydrogenase